MRDGSVLNSGEWIDVDWSPRRLRISRSPTAAATAVGVGPRIFREHRREKPVERGWNVWDKRDGFGSASLRWA